MINDLLDASRIFKWTRRRRLVSKKRFPLEAIRDVKLFFVFIPMYKTDNFRVKGSALASFSMVGSHNSFDLKPSGER